MNRERGARRAWTGIRERLTYANAMATIAVFIALGGGAYALSRGEVKSKHIAGNAVKSKHIRNGHVRNPDLRGGAVTAGKLADGAVNSAKVADGSLTGADVADDSLTGADVDESSLEGVDAATLDGRPRTDYVFRSFISSPANRQTGMIFYAYRLITPEAGTDYSAGQIKLRTTAVAQQFQVCGATGLSDPVQYVQYIDGVRAVDTVPGDGCDPAVSFGSTCDFEIVAAQGTRVFGAPTLPAGDNCQLLVLQAS